VDVADSGGSPADAPLSRPGSVVVVGGGVVAVVVVLDGDPPPDPSPPGLVTAVEGVGEVVVVVTGLGLLCGSGACASTVVAVAEGALVDVVGAGGAVDVVVAGAALVTVLVDVVLELTWSPCPSVEAPLPTPPSPAVPALAPPSCSLAAGAATTWTTSVAVAEPDDMAVKCAPAALLRASPPASASARAASKPSDAHSRDAPASTPRTTRRPLPPGVQVMSRVLRGPQTPRAS
jgi:hypothetical protein